MKLTMSAMRRQGRLAIPLVGLAVAGPMACGENDEDKLRSLAELVPEEDPAICASLTKRFLDDYFGGGVAKCRNEVRQQDEWIKARRVVIDGATATVTADSSDEPLMLRFVKSDGKWKLDALSTVESPATERSQEEAGKARGSSRAPGRQK